MTEWAAFGGENRASVGIAYSGFDRFQASQKERGRIADSKSLVSNAMCGLYPYHYGSDLRKCTRCKIFRMNHLPALLTGFHRRGPKRGRHPAIEAEAGRRHDAVAWESVTAEPPVAGQLCVPRKRNPEFYRARNGVAGRTRRIASAMGVTHSSSNRSRSAGVVGRPVVADSTRLSWVRVA